MNKVSDLRDLCQLWADDVASFEEQGRIDRVTADALARIARSFFTGLISVVGVRRLVPARAGSSGSSIGATLLSTGRMGLPGFSGDASTVKTEGSPEKKRVVVGVSSVQPENKAKTESVMDLWNFAETEGETVVDSCGTENARKNRL